MINLINIKITRFCPYIASLIHFSSRDFVCFALAMSLSDMQMKTEFNVWNLCVVKLKPFVNYYGRGRGLDP